MGIRWSSGTPDVSIPLKKVAYDQNVIPAKAGIQVFHQIMDPGFRRGDVQMTFSTGC